MNLSVVIICKNKKEAEGTVESVSALHPQFLIDEARSGSLGERKNKLVQMADREWILVLDTDEFVSPQLTEEIKNILSKKNNIFVGYAIAYQNYVFGKPVYFGGEAYAKVRLFKNGYGHISQVPLHEEIEITGKIGTLRGMIHHYSYKNPWQLFLKFTHYAWIASRQKKSTLTGKKLFLYGPHMFWARFIKDQGWKDGWRGFVLALSFGYMETLTYWLAIIP